MTGDPDPHITAQDIERAVAQRTRPGSIVIMHMNGRGWHTAEALPTVIKDLRRRGYQFVTVSQALQTGAGLTAMPILDVTEFDFSQEHARDDGQVARRVAVVRNPDARAVLHVGVKASVPWLDVYPSEFALAPQEAQTVTAELRPERARNAALAAATVSVRGQFIAVLSGEAPPEFGAEIGVVPPLAVCPNCGAELPDGARECRRCGERIRLCPVCGTPNTWIARVCRRSRGPRPADGDGLAHVPRRRRRAWGRARAPLGVHLARRWSAPSYPVEPGGGRGGVERAAGGVRHGGRVGHRAGAGPGDGAGVRAGDGRGAVGV